MVPVFSHRQSVQCSECGILRIGCRNGGRFRKDQSNRPSGLHAVVIYCSLPAKSQFCIVYNLSNSNCLQVSSLFCRWCASEHVNILQMFHISAASLAKQALPIADLSTIKTSGRMDIGGIPQSLAWDSKGQHLAVSFKDCPAIALFLTAVNKTNISIAPDCFLVGVGTAFPSYICFQESVPETRTDRPQSVLTIGWSSGVVQYFPFI